MATFFMFGKYSLDAEKEISAQRTTAASEVIRGLGGEFKSAYALLGVSDLVLIVELPGVNEAVKASVELGKKLGISFTTSPAMSVEEFDELIQGS